jgi:hypothetical protein
MTDSAGLALGALSLFGQTLTACVHGFERYNKFNQDLGTEFTDLQVNLAWTRSRLATWALDWGIDEGRHLHDDRFQKHVEMAASHLAWISYLLFNLDKDEEDFQTMEAAGSQVRTPVAALAMWSKTGDVSTTELKGLIERIEKLNAEAGTAEKFRYYLANGRAGTMAERVKSMVEDLFLQFPPPRVDAAASVLSSRLLQSNDATGLDAAVRSGTLDPLLEGLALLKLESLRLERRAEQLASTNPREPPRVIVEGSEVWDGLRGTAVYLNEEKLPRRVPVLVEKKEVPSEPRYARHNDRIHDIARLMSVANKKPAEMRTLDCLGVVSVSYDTQTTHKLLYRLPATDTRIFTLKGILKGQREEPTFPQGKKFACARALSRAVLWLHMAGWLHKDIRSDNIIFFSAGDDQRLVNLAEPYLCGFEYSRSITAPLDTEPLAGDAGNNLYRHPDVQGLPEDGRGTARPEFDQAHDVYALGVVLLELGSHRSLRGLQEKYEKASGLRWSAQPFREWLIAEQIASLAPRMGEIYTDVVRVCLTGLKVDEGRTFQETFYVKVIKKLDLCVV